MKRILNVKTKIKGGKERKRGRVAKIFYISIIIKFLNGKIKEKIRTN